MHFLESRICRIRGGCHHRDSFSFPLFFPSFSFPLLPGDTATENGGPCGVPWIWGGTWAKLLEPCGMYSLWHLPISLHTYKPGPPVLWVHARRGRIFILSRSRPYSRDVSSVSTRIFKHDREYPRSQTPLVSAHRTREITTKIENAYDFDL